MLRLGSIVLVLSIGAVAVVGCGSGSGSEFGSGGGGGDGTSGGASSGGFTNGTSSGGGASGGTSGDVGEVGNVSPTDACATSNAGATLPPVSLVFMIDKSGSMGNTQEAGQNLAVRWQPVVAGLKAFYGDAASSNLSASLAFFPANSNQCTVSNYSTPAVTMTQLPNTSVFATALDGTSPNGGTPTEPALQGALDYARTHKAAGKNVAIVLATDGEPNNCNSDVAGVGAIAVTGVGEGIKTYVIGVGPSTGNLDSIAADGGTTSAIMIPTNNPSQVSADLIKALGGIASSLLGCTYTLPNPPAGQTLDITKVNVNYTPANSQTQTLPYSADCSNKGGWHYDNTAAPKEILLCDEMCATAKSASGAKLDVIFGCKTAAKPGEEPK